MKRILVLGLLPLVFGFVRAQDTTKLPSIGLDEIAQRRAKLMEKLDGAIVAHAGKERTGQDEWPTEGEVTSGLSFFYLVGSLIPDAVLVLNKSAVLFVKGDLAKAKQRTGIEDVRELEKLESYLKETVKEGTIYADSRKGLSEALNEDVEVNVQKFSGEIAAMRMIKSPAEIRMMRYAADVTAQAQRNAMKISKPGCNEADLAKVIEQTYKDGKCDKFAFPSIVGGSKNSPVIHYMKNNQELSDGDLVLVDIGASFRGYATDFTRTWPVNGKFSDKQRKAYEAVLASQKAAEQLLKPGVRFSDLEKAARKSLVDAGYKKTGYMNFHGLGHFVGLQTHDVGGLAGGLQPGMVITIEPGIYDKKEQISIRIEDTYVVTEKGFERLTDGCTREADEIEKILTKKKDY